MKIHSSVSLLILLASFLAYGQESGDAAKRLGTMTQLREPPKIIQGPLVVGTGADWAIIQWTTNAEGRKISVVYVGTDKKDLRRAEQSADPVNISDVPSYQEQQYTHLVRLNHLDPGTTYYFKVDSGSGHETGASNISQLTTTKRFGLTTSGPSIQ
jgi:hypothetical protein